MIVDGEERHYTAIRSISRFLSRPNRKTKCAYHYCLNCLNGFRTESARDKHRINLINSVKSISDNFGSFSDNVQRDVLLYGDSRFDTNKNKLILEATISYIKNTDRFAGSLFG